MVAKKKVAKKVGPKRKTSPRVLSRIEKPSHVSKVPTSDTPKPVLVVGDWLINDHWLLVQHDSDTSSYTGLGHYRSFYEKNTRFRCLNGAGRVAHLLHGFRTKDSTNEYFIWGLGHWHKDDCDIILHLFHQHPKLLDRSEFPEGDPRKCDFLTTEYQVRKELCREPPKHVRVFSLNEKATTLRALRLYHCLGSKKELVSRVDWELREPLRETHLNGAEKVSIPRDMRDENIKNNIRNIVAVDFLKGAFTVNDGLIDSLTQTFGSARYYVRSKKNNPQWVKHLIRWGKKVGKDPIKLRFIGPEVAEMENPLGCWIAKCAGKSPSKASYGMLKEGKRLSRAGFDMLKKVGTTPTLLVTDGELIARAGNRLITGSISPVGEIPAQVGWPNAVFATVIGATIEQDDVTIDGMISGLDNTKNTDPFKISDVIEHNEWPSEEKLWDAALNHNRLGIISKEKDKLVKGNKIATKEGGTNSLEVWRASTDLPGYIACSSERREVIKNIGAGLRSFKANKGRGRSLSVMVTADPGSGKTTMVRALATSFNFKFLAYNLTQMIHREELLAIFDEINTRQVLEPNEDFIVFVDEANAQVEAGRVYGMFLTPLEEGTYAHRGRIFTIKPCVWIFAGTQSVPKHNGNKQKAHSDHSDSKESDFYSRVTLKEQMDYQSLYNKAKDKGKKSGRTTALTDFKNKTRLERVYLCAKLIQEHWPDVQYVTKEVLQKFHDMRLGSGPGPDKRLITVRELRKHVASFRNVQHGRVSRDNWHTGTWKKRSTEEERTWIKLVF